MKFSERTQFLYDPQLFKRGDVLQQQKFVAEYYKKSAGQPYPKFLEVSKDRDAIDPLWHTQTGTGVQKFSREISVPSIHQFEKAHWGLRSTGRSSDQTVRFWVAYLELQCKDYFPVMGDLVYWGGYRLIITNIGLEPACYFQQTNAWTALVVTAILGSEGDSRPVVNPSIVTPAEKAANFTAPGGSRC